MTSIGNNNHPLSWLPYKQALLPGFAGCCAVSFSHPLEMTKVRLQLDNELAKKGAVRAYRGFIHCISNSWKTQGIIGLQRGLSFGMAREFCFNALRIGAYDPSLAAYALTLNGAEPSTFEKFAVGLCVGALAGAIVNPLEVLKTRNQAFGGLTGHQHKQSTTGVWQAAQRLWLDEGARGFVRGIEVQTARGFLGAGTQLPSYNYLKSTAASNGFDSTSPTVHIVCSALSAGMSILFCNPADVIRTRLYNQPFDEAGRGLFYKGTVDAFTQVVRLEGFAALYKGAVAHYARLGPHIILVFCFLEQFKKWT